MADPPAKRGGARSTTRSKGNGPGWGGSAKGAGTPGIPAAPAFEPGNRLGHIPTPERRREAQEDREEALAFYRSVMRDKTKETTNRLAATDKLLDRVEGRAIARNLNASTDDLSDIDDAVLDRRRADLEARLREGAGGTAPPGLPN